MRFYLRYWLPVLIWLVVIFAGSSDLLSAEHTSRFIGPFLRWFAPDISPETIASTQLFVRKCAHLAVYAVLAALLYRALLQNIRQLGRAAAVAFMIAVAYAVFDEFHQSFVASRTGSPWDVLVDAGGAGLALLIVQVCQSRFGRKSST